MKRKLLIYPMKKFLLLIPLIFLTFHCHSQIEEGESLINFGIGIGSIYTSGGGYKSVVPPIEGSYEYMVSDKISAGGFIGYYKSTFQFDSPLFDDDEDELFFTFFGLGALGNYHFVNDEKFNVYAGAKLGYLSVNSEDENNSDEDGIFDSANLRTSGALFGIQAGARYFISEKFAINAELGIGIALFKIGATIKL